MQTFDPVGFGSLVLRTLSCFQMRPPHLFDTLSEIHLLLDIGFFVWTTVWTFGFMQQLGTLYLLIESLGGGVEVWVPNDFFQQICAVRWSMTFLQQIFLLVVVHDFATDLHMSGLNVKINEHSNRLHLTVHFRKLLLSGLGSSLDFEILRT